MASGRWGARLEELASFHPSEFVLGLFLAGLALGVRVALPRAGLPATANWLARHPRQVPVRREQILRLADLASRFAPGCGQCLVRSLIVLPFLDDARLAIGVLREGAHIDAHAWIERAGRAVGESREKIKSYVPLARLGAR